MRPYQTKFNLNKRYVNMPNQRPLLRAVVLLIICPAFLQGCPIERRAYGEAEPGKYIFIHNQCGYDVTYSTKSQADVAGYILIFPSSLPGPIYFSNVAEITLKSTLEHRYFQRSEENVSGSPRIILKDDFKLLVNTKEHGQKIYTAKQLLESGSEFNDGFLFLNYSFDSELALLQISFCKE